MATTYLQLKNATANIFGRSDGATADTVRDNDINSAIRFDIANAYPFSWLRKSTTLNLDSSGQADLPSDFNPTHQPYDLYSSTNTHYSPIQREAYYSTANTGTSPYYYLDYNTSTDRWRVTANTPSVTVTAVYYHIPAELSADADITIVPDPMAIVYLAAAHVWIGFYFDESNHDRFEQLGERRIQKMISMDKRSNPQRLKRGSAYTEDLGYNLPGDASSIF